MVFYAQHLPTFIFANSMPVYSLTDLNQHIRETIADTYPENLWVRAEIVSMNVNGYSGHCYLELTDSKEGASSKMKAMIWKGSLKQIDQKFNSDRFRMLVY
jgi:exonuclease VII large subunit